MPRNQARSGVEFIALLALTTSLVAMSIDTMLPALGDIATELGAAHENDRQLILTAFFAGLTVGQLVYGPVSDSTGRKPMLYTGIGLFLVGGLICAQTTSFALLLFGRALQGLGAAGPRVMAIATVRDRFSGPGMARVMSFVTSVFILVPVVAPAFGQAILSIASWRAIFWVLCAVACVDLLWFGLRQPETLLLEHRVRLSFRTIFSATGEAFRNRITLGYTLASGCIFGGLINYLSTSQQVFQEQYGLGGLFPVLFGILALSIGVASFVNAKLVMQFGMRTLSKWAALIQCSFSSFFLGVTWIFDGHPPFLAFMGYMVVCFFCNGLLFGNYNARAMEPMGHIAGVAAAVIGFVSNLVALALGTPLGRFYDGTVVPIVGGFALLSVMALLLTAFAERNTAKEGSLPIHEEKAAPSDPLHP